MARNHGVGHRHARRSDAPLDRRLVAPVHRRPQRRSRLCSAPNRWRHRRSSRSKPTSTTTPAHSTASARTPLPVDMAAATTALQAMIATVGPNAPIRLTAITSAHAALMHDDPPESSAAGELRTVQNRIGGSGFSREARSISRGRRKQCRPTWTTSSPSPIGATCRHRRRRRSRMRHCSRGPTQ
jgi:hypothetical protein